MNDQKEMSDSINASISGNISGNVAVGKNISQVQNTLVSAHNEVTEKDLDTLENLLNVLVSKVEKEAPPDKKRAALERVQELKESITDEKPDLTTMEYVRSWFGKNIPQLAGYIAGVLVNPIVGKVIEATGEIASGELKKRFGH